jgi:hypothetical protein
MFTSDPDYWNLDTYVAGTYDKCANEPGMTVLHMTTTAPTIASFGPAFQITNAEFDFYLKVGGVATAATSTASTDGLLGMMDPYQLEATGKR